MLPPVGPSASWRPFLTAAVLAAPDDTRLVALAPEFDEEIRATLSETAWAVTRGIVHLACSMSTSDITRVIKGGGSPNKVNTFRDTIVLLVCPLDDSNRILADVPQGHSSPWVRWVVVADGDAPLLATLLPLVTPGLQMTAVKYSDESDLYEIFSSAPLMDNTPAFQKVGSWKGSSVRGPQPFLAPLLYPAPEAAYHDLKGQRLKVAVVDNWPFFGLVERPDGTWEPSSGIDHRVLEVLAQKMNFTYEIVSPEDRKWGGVQDDGYISGMIGMVARREAVFAIDEITISEAREMVVDFTSPYFVDSSVMVSRAPVEANRALAVFLPFSKTVWGAVVGVLIATILAALGMIAAGGDDPSTRYGKLHQKHNRVPLSPSATAFLMFRSLVVQGNNLAQLPGNGLRLMLGSWFLFCLIIYAMYAGTLTAVLAAPSLETPIDSLAHLLAASQEGRVVPATLAGGSLDALLAEADRGLYHQLFAFMKPDVSFVSSVDEGVHAALAGESVYMGGSLTMELRTVSVGRDKFYLSRDRFYMQGYGVACQQGSPIRIVMEALLSRMVCSGLIQRWRSDEVRRATSKMRRATSKVEAAPFAGNRSITLTHLQGAFMVYLLGFGTAVVALLLELLVRRVGYKGETLAARH